MILEANAEDIAAIFIIFITNRYFVFLSKNFVFGLRSVLALIIDIGTHIFPNGAIKFLNFEQFSADSITNEDISTRKLLGVS